MKRAKLEADAVEDVILGCGSPEGATGHNVARLAVGVGRARFQSRGGDDQPLLLLGPPIDRADRATTSCRTARKSASPAALNSISLTRLSNSMNKDHVFEEKLQREHPEMWMPMIETADIVAKRYNVSREYQDEYSLRSQQRIAAAQAKRHLQGRDRPDEDEDEEWSTRRRRPRASSTTVVDRDDCNRPDTTLEGLAKLEPVRGPGNFVTAGNASQADTDELVTDDDGWTLRSATGCLTAHSEHTIAITEDGAEILTLPSA